MKDTFWSFHGNLVLQNSSNRTGWRDTLANPNHLKNQTYEESECSDPDADDDVQRNVCNRNYKTGVQQCKK